MIKKKEHAKSTQSKTAQSVIFVDADNTLWDTNKIFAEAQLGLLSAVETAVEHKAITNDRLGFIRVLDQGLAEKHHSRLRYPPRLLVKALAIALAGKPAKVAVRLAWSGGREGNLLSDEQAIKIEAEFLAQLRTLPPLRSGVRKGLKELRKANYVVIVLTEGNRDKTLRTIAQHKLGLMIDRVIEAKKNCQLFERLLRLMHVKTAFVIGDQLDRDIRPAKEAGLLTIYFPGGFRPKWESPELTVRPDYEVERFDKVPKIIATEELGRI